jgi:hypothetical protein
MRKIERKNVSRIFWFTETPFTLTPDPRFIVFTPSYNEVLASLITAGKRQRLNRFNGRGRHRKKRRRCAGFCGGSIRACWRLMFLTRAFD